MDLRTKISAALKQAMKDKDADRLSTLRLINAAIKDKDIDARAAGQDDGVGEDEVLGILGKMVKQRRESAKTYEEGGRLDLAERELNEIKVIEEYLPQKLAEPGKFSSASSSTRIVVTSRSFVGSSTSSRLPPTFSIFASWTRLR